MRLKNKVAIFTGSSKGIGAAIVKALANEGARVVVNYLHSRAAAEAVLAEIVSKGGDHRSESRSQRRLCMNV